ncbi:hypothetical protein Tco_1273464 [Tanacetum coccineum]
MEKYEYQADVSRLMDLIVNAFLVADKVVVSTISPKSMGTQINKGEKMLKDLELSKATEQDYGKEKLNERIAKLSGCPYYPGSDIVKRALGYPMKLIAKNVGQISLGNRDP